MKFKLKALAAACTMAFASHSFAAVLPTDTPAVVLHMSGSSALQNAASMIAEHLFQSGQVIEMWDGDGSTSAGTKGSNQRAYIGYVKTGTLPDGTAVPSSIAGKEVLVYYRAQGGSVYGVVPVAEAQSIAFLNPATCSASAVKTNSLTGIPVYSCTGTTNAVTDAGISDVDPATNNAPINSASVAGVLTFPALTAAQLANLNSTSVLAQVFGIPVNGTSTQGSLHPATAPMLNLTSAQAAGLMGGTVTDWNMIDASIPAGTTSIVICRRQPGSGTQASINAFLFGAPCSSGAASPLTYAGGNNATLIGKTTAVGAGNIVVVENSSSGNVAQCMTYVNSSNGTQAIDVTTGNLVTPGSKNSVVLDATKNTYYGIGLMGLDHAVGTDIYQNTNLNGNVASLANASMGYNIMVESTFNAGTALSALGAGNPKFDLYTMMVTEGGSPTVLGSAAGGVPGVLGLSENGWTAPTTFSSTFPVARVGNFGNNCSPLQQLQ
jgi:hypothetical protein